MLFFAVFSRVFLIGDGATPLRCPGALRLLEVEADAVGLFGCSTDRFVGFGVGLGAGLGVGLGDGLTALGGGGGDRAGGGGGAGTGLGPNPIASSA